MLKLLLPKLVDFGKELIPYFFSEKPFSPKKFTATVLTIVLLSLGNHYLGTDTMEDVLEQAEDVMEIIEE